MNELIKNLQKPLPGDVALLIRDSFFCEIRNNQVEVCCPVTGIVPPANVQPATQKLGKLVIKKMLA